MSNVTIGTKRLSEVKNGAGIPFLTPEVSPGTHCPMRLASVISQDIKGLSSLLVGMPECATYSRLFNPMPENESGDLSWLYVLDSREIVFGCREGVMEALLKMQSEGAKAILVTGTCIPDLIGEDFKGLIEELKSSLNIKVAQTMLGQFKNISYPSGSWKTMEAMAQLMERKEVAPNVINVLGRSSSEEDIPMPSLFTALEAQGITVRCLAPGSTLEAFQSASEAGLNIVISPYGQPLAVAMQKAFNTPFISLHDSYAVSEIDTVIKQIYNHLHLTLESEFETERLHALALEQEARGYLERKRFSMTLRIDLPLPLTRYLVSAFQMKPVLLHLEEYYPEDKGHSKAIKRLGVDPLVCRIVDEDKAWPLIEAHEPELVLGYLPLKNESIPLVENLLDFYGQVGYARTAGLLMRMMDSLKEKEVPHGVASV